MPVEFSVPKKNKTNFVRQHLIQKAKKRLFDSTLIVNSGSKFKGGGGVKASLLVQLTAVKNTYINAKLNNF